MNPPPYLPRRAPRSRFVTVRGLRYHLLEWGAPVAGRAPLVMAHGWMDVAASFQFVVDAFAQERHVVALDWRGFGASDAGPGGAYWFPDYLADLDALLDAPELGLAGAPVDLLGHSMGGNVVMLYAGVRPARVRRLVNLEGFGMPKAPPELAPRRYAQWLDELRAPARLKPYVSLDAVAARLRETNPLLAPDKAAWLAGQWASETPDGRWALRADPAHKRANPVLYRVDEVLACWKRIEAPLLWVEGDRTDVAKWWGHRYPRAEFDERLAVVPNVERCTLSPAGHMLHHDQPEALAARLETFLG
ncbi:MAG: alpha/beta hydrolase [Piscinibacter sp.]|nr:alpha/beta hydrolase [Piscinibacter sp.]